jgi:hypothetical protein
MFILLNCWIYFSKIGNLVFTFLSRFTFLFEKIYLPLMSYVTSKTPFIKISMIALVLSDVGSKKISWALNLQLVSFRTFLSKRCVFPMLFKV